MALVFLVLLGRFAYMQVVAHDYYTGQAEHMRTSIALLEPHRADIVLRDGTLVAHTETVWDVYIDLEAFADPRTLPLRRHVSPRHYDAGTTQAFVDGPLKAVQEAELPSPASRRRWFLNWRLRQDPVARADFELCAQRLCMVTGLTRAELDQKLNLLATEVNALADQVGDPVKADGRETSVAWLRAKPALTDPDYWERIRRFPKSLHFAPVLQARLEWLQKESEYLGGLLQAADGDAERLRDLCFQAMKTCRERANSLQLEVDPGELTHSQAQDILLEEHGAWLRLARTCEAVVRGDKQAVIGRHHALSDKRGLVNLTAERLERLQKHVLERHAQDWTQRWQHYTLEENPLLLVREAPRDVIELLKVNGDLLPGVRCERRASRKYSFSRELVHVLGNVGLPDAAQLEGVLSRPSFGEGLDEFIETWFEGDRGQFVQKFDGAVALNAIGIRGIEHTYDERLSGLYGARAGIRDAGGRTRSIEYEQAPTHPQPLTLTIDIELQRDLLATIRKWEPALNARVLTGKKARRWESTKWSFRGCAIVMDVKTGEVLAMVSLPDYDPEALKGRTAADRSYQRQLQLEEQLESAKGFPRWNQHARHVNRATQGAYAPGSTFKVLTAMALLDSGTLTPADTFDEIGEYKNGAYEIKWQGKRLGSTGHPIGPNVNLRLALEASSNGFFYRWAQSMGETPSEAWENLRGYAEMFGFGVACDSDFYFRRAQLPHPEDVWAPNLAMLAIGQGAMTCAPMELARLYACIANRGTLLTPHLAEEAQTWPAQLDLPAETWDAIHDGMRRVVYGSRGTAREHPVLRRIRCAGKTGTAENGRGVPDHAWFAGFAPHDDPQVAFVILAANSDLYGGDIAPVIGEAIERHLQRTGVLAQVKK
ncbi:MAG: hypothetical protein IT464_09405 [Planctomycetes bacterium]|nr:hypothetical protein [Planctomycetota bacterium]